MYAFLCVGQKTAVGEKLGTLNSSAGVYRAVDVLSTLPLGFFGVVRLSLCETVSVIASLSSTLQDG